MCNIDKCLYLLDHMSFKELFQLIRILVYFLNLASYAELDFKILVFKILFSYP